MIFIDYDGNGSWEDTKKNAHSRIQFTLNQEFSDYLKLLFSSTVKEEQTIENYKFQNDNPCH